MSDPLPRTVSEVAPTTPWTDCDPDHRGDPLDHLPTTERYVLGAEIARGGMGVVYRCRDGQLGRDLAVKVLLSEVADRPRIVRRFLEEARIAGQLQHPGVVPVHELGKLPDGRLFFAMKLVQGRTLAVLLAQRASPAENLPALLKVFEQICQTLAYAHDNKVIHRDLKPLNVMVGAFGEVQVMDWGLAKVLRIAATPLTCGLRIEDEESGNLQSEETQAGTVLGTFAYMAPEQARGETDSLDERCDVFGLGAILCEILTGAPPYAGRTTAAVRDHALAANLEPVQRRLDQCGADAELVALCRRCLAANPADRPRDGRVVAELMTGYLAGVAERLHAAEIERAAVEARARAERGKRRLTVALASTVVVALVLAGGTWAWLHEQQRVRDEQTAQNANQAIGKARSLRQDAADVGLVDLAAWQKAAELRARALVAGEEADRILADSPDSAARGDLDELLPVLRAEAAAGARNHDLLKLLQEASFQANDAVGDDDMDRAIAEHGNDDRYIYSRSAGSAEYARAFREHGLDLDSLSPDAFVAAVPPALRLDLAAALDDWLRLADAGAQRDRLLALAVALDPDPLRNRLRTAALRRDLPTLRELAVEPAIAGQPVPALLLLAEALFDADAVEPAIDLLRRAQVARPGEFWLNNKLGEYLMYRGGTAPVHVEEATRFFTAALTTRPGSQAARVNLGDALAFLGAHAEAQATYRVALEQRPDLAYARTKLAVALVIAGRYAEALDESRRAATQRPDSAWAQDANAAVCHMAGRNDEAVAAARRAIALAPHVAAYHSTLGDALGALERRAEALAAHREAYRLKQTAATRANLIEALVRAAKKTEALQLARAAAKLHPGSAQVLGALAMALDAVGRSTEAVETLREATAQAPYDAGLWWRLASVLRRLERLDEATAAARAALRHGPQQGPRRAALFQELARIHTARKHFDAAVEACREALDCKPEDPVLWRDLARALENQDNLPAAAQAYREALALKLDDPAARRGLVEIRQRQGRTDEALALCEDAPETLHREFDVLRGRLLRDLGRLKEALRVLSPYRVASTAAAAQACALRGAILRKLDRLPEAIDAYRRAVVDPGLQGYVRACIDLGDVLLEQSRRDAAAGDPTDARKNAFDGHIYRGWGLRTQGCYPEAITAYRAAIETDPKDPLGHIGLGETLRLSHQPETARPAYEAALKLDPKHSRALRGLGQTLCDLELFAAAVPELEAALRHADDPAPIRVELATLQCRLGRFSEAARQFGKAKQARAVAHCERLLALQSRLEEFATGKTEPATDDLLDLTDLCSALGRPVAASRFFRAAVRAGKLGAGDRLEDRAVQAVLASGSPGLSVEDQRLLRADARTWLRLELANQSRQVAEGRDPNAVVGVLARWKRTGALARVRDLATLPEEERPGWRAFWDEVALVRKLAELKLDTRTP